MIESNNRKYQKIQLYPKSKYIDPNTFKIIQVIIHLSLPSHNALPSSSALRRFFNLHFYLFLFLYGLRLVVCGDGSTVQPGHLPWGAKNKTMMSRLSPTKYAKRKNFQDIQIPSNSNPKISLPPKKKHLNFLL